MTLRGEAESTRVRDEAERIARGVDGVTEVENRIRVRGEAQPAERASAERDADGGSPDGWLTAKVQARYFLDSDVKGRNINVDTRDGVVTLTGEVESEAERRQAIALARNTDGVRQVNDQLRLQPSDAGRDADARGRTARSNEREGGATFDDTWITTKIQSRYFLDTDVKGRAIDVDTRRGVVTLKGTVESDAERKLAETIAQQTDGATRVVNQLRVAATTTQ